MQLIAINSLTALNNTVIIIIIQYLNSNKTTRKDVEITFLSCRWGNTPIDEATYFGQHDVLALLQEYNNKYNPPVNTDADKESTEKNLDGMLET